jgi:serine/threonine protein kinase
MQVVFPSENTPSQVGPYSILWSHLLGKGTTGTVYQAIDTLTKTPLAAKVIDSSTIKDDATRSLLENEKLALQSVDHANVLKLKEILDQDGKCFIITELC